MADETTTGDGVPAVGAASAHGTRPVPEHAEGPDGTQAADSLRAAVSAEGPEAIIAPDPQQQHRAEKLAARRAQGEHEPYRWDITSNAQQIHDTHADLAAGTETEDQVSLAGRLKFIRRQGKLTFAVLQDRTSDIQLFVDTRTIGDQAHHDFDDLDRGDWVGVTGVVMRTRRGEISVRVQTFALLGKALRPPPDKDKPFDDVELRSRQRYVDLMVNEKTRHIFDVRFKVLRAIRDYLQAHDYFEVEGPMLQSIQGGALARPFITHHNTLDIDLYLRIALELHLKRLIVGGLERVFEIGRVFRNEGIDTRHNPEFTLLEAYQAFADYHDMMDLVEEMIKAAAHAALGDDITVTLQGAPLDLSKPWPRLTFTEMIEQYTGATMHPDMPVEEARALLDERGVAYEFSWNTGQLMKQMYDEKVQHSVRGPVFCMDYPAAVSPLARVSRKDPAYAERFELIVGGSELCNAYSEQNDPDVQLKAFEEEARAKAQGDPEAGDIDYDYVRALQYGMPCTGGIGIGIDRLVMLIASVDSIREVILFPTMRPEFDTGPKLPGPAGNGAGSSLAGMTGASGLARRAAAGAGARVSVDGSVVMLPGAQEAMDESALTARLGAERKRAKLVGWVAMLGGLILALTQVPGFHSELIKFEGSIGPRWFSVTWHVITLGVGLIQIFLATQLRKQKRRAWQISLVFFTIGAIASVLKGPHLITLVYCLLTLVLLIVNRRIFRARSDPPSLLRLAWMVPAYIGIVFAFGLTALYFNADRMTPDLTFPGALQTIVQGLVGIPGPYTYEREFFAAFFPAALLTLGIIGVVGLLVLIFRPLQSRQSHTEEDWERAERLVKSYGWDTLAYFALRDDKSFFFSSDGEAMIAYTYINGYALASGDPIGADDSIALVLDEFRDFCRGRGWVPAFLAVREADMPLYTARAFKSFYLGDEAIIDCDTFTLEGSAMKGVRAAVRKVGRTYSFRLMSEAQTNAELVRQLNAISEKWRGKAPERGFTMSLSQDIEGVGRNPEFLLCVALDENGVPGGFLRIVPVYGQRLGYTLDLMRHDPDAPNGMTEFLISQSALALKERGVDRLSMNFAMWGRLFEPAEHANWRQRMATRFAKALNPFFQIQSLHDFNEKFSPTWVSRVLVYRDEADLPRVGLLYAGAEGFLALPGGGSMFVPKPVGGVESPSGPGSRERSGAAA